MVENMDSDGAASRITNAVSIFGQGDAGDEFPVLKAFQQYIDAEQAKARKRMFGLCAFFVVLMTIVIVAFVAILASSVSRNQQLSDRLLELALRDRGGVAPVVVNQQPQAESLKPLLEQLAGAIKDRQSPAPAGRAAPTPESRLENARVKLELEKLAAERAELAAEKEKVRQLEVERQRRRLYPEYYAKLERDREVEAAADRAAADRAAGSPASAAPAAGKNGKSPEGTVDFALPMSGADGRKMRWHLPVPE